MGMAQGKNTIPFLEGLVVGDIKGIEDGSGSYSIFTNENGGIIDDTVISKVCTCHSYKGSCQLIGLIWR